MQPFVRTINEHLQNLFKTNELEETSVIRKFRITAADGKNYLTNFYNLDAITGHTAAELIAERATHLNPIWD